jgi:hypothetical protein
MASTYSLNDVVALARHANMSSTYKPALLKALAVVCGRSPSPRIGLPVLGREFTRFYWNQTVVFHLRQAATIKKEPEVSRRIRRVAKQFQARFYSEVPASAQLALESEIAQVLKIDVLRRFHASKPAGMSPLFDWEAGADAIELSNDAIEFIVRNRSAIEVIANYWWAMYLEKVNVLAPAIIDKVRREGAQRTRISRFLAILAAVGEDRCFYCECDLRSGVEVQVDHVIPWSYLLADPAWDLVLACRSCNAAKSDWLPERSFIDKLSSSNRRRESLGVRAYVGPPPIEPPSLLQLYDAALAVEWPGCWSP